MKHIAMIFAVGALLAGALVVPAQAASVRFGRVWAADKVLREGCHSYRYQYVVRPRAHNWGLETFLHAPSGRTIASGALGFEADRKRGDGRFQFCNDVTRAGRYKITGRLTWKTCDFLNNCTDHVRWVKPGYFRMRRP